MSEASKTARAAMKKKIARITGGDPRTKVDASSWTPPEMMNTEAKTGLRPVSRRAFKKGGKVVVCMGEDAKQNAGKKPRKAGGGEATAIANAKINRNVKEANAEKFGKPHTGGYRNGGRTHKNMGGPMADPRLDMVKKSLSALGAGAVPGLKNGGKSDASRDKKLIKKAFRQHESAEHGGKHVPLKLLKGGRTCKQDGGDVITKQPKEAPMPTQEEVDRYEAMLAAKAEAEKARKEAEEALKAREGKKYGGSAKHKAGGGDVSGIMKRLQILEDARRNVDMDPTNEKGAALFGGAREASLRSKRKAAAIKAAEMMRDSSRGPSGDELQETAPQRYKTFRSKNLEPDIAPLSARDKLMNKLQGVDDDSYAKGGKIKMNYKGGTRPTGGRLAKAYGGGLMGELAGAKSKGKGKKGKGKTDITININTSPKSPMTPPPGPPMMPPGPPPGPPPGMMPPPPGGPMGMPPGGPPMPPPGMMGRKAGGRVGHRTYRSYKDMDAGSGGGLGRLEKTEIQEHKANRKEGGRVGHRKYRSYKDMDAGSGGGLGRLEKTEIQEHKVGRREGGRVGMDTGGMPQTMGQLGNDMYRSQVFPQTMGQLGNDTFRSQVFPQTMGQQMGAGQQLNALGQQGYQFPGSPEQQYGGAERQQQLAQQGTAQQEYGQLTNAQQKYAFPGSPGQQYGYAQGQQVPQAPGQMGSEAAQLTNAQQGYAFPGSPGQQYGYAQGQQVPQGVAQNNQLTNMSTPQNKS